MSDPRDPGGQTLVTAFLILLVILGFVVNLGAPFVETSSPATQAEPPAGH